MGGLPLVGQFDERDLYTGLRSMAVRYRCAMTEPSHFTPLGLSNGNDRPPLSGPRRTLVPLWPLARSRA
jgi:hypothetical protein